MDSNWYGNRFSGIELFNTEFEFKRNEYSDESLILKRQGIPGCGVIYFRIRECGKKDAWTGIEQDMLPEVIKQLQVFQGIFEKETKKKTIVGHDESAMSKLSRIKEILMA
jgi:hypothetical protein